MKHYLALSAAFLALGLMSVACNAEAQECAGAAQRTFTVSGEGEASAVPDLARIRAGVRTQAADAKNALAANTAAMNKVFDAMRKVGIADKDMRTSEVSVRPLYAHQPQTEPAKIIGYQVSNQVTVAVRDLSKLGTALDAFVAAGANELGGISFSIDKPGSLLDEARKAAIADARRKAELMAKAAGVKLGKLITMTESGGSGPVPRLAYARAVEAAPVPTAAGEQTESAHVSLTFEIE